MFLTLQLFWLQICSYDFSVLFIEFSIYLDISAFEDVFLGRCWTRGNIIYSYKYLESDLIKYVKFIHSLGQPLIVRSHSKVHRSRGNPKEIPTWASRVSNYSYFPWASSDSFVAVGEEEILYIISNIFAKPQVFYYLVSDAKIFHIIYQLSPLLECDPTVCLDTLGWPGLSFLWETNKPSGDITFLWETIRLVTLQQGW
jgi:hypothetical protein